MVHPLTPLQKFIKSQGFGMTVAEFGEALVKWDHPPCPIGQACIKVSKEYCHLAPQEQMDLLMKVWEDEFTSMYWSENMTPKAEKYTSGDAYFA